MFRAVKDVRRWSRPLGLRFVFAATVLTGGVPALAETFRLDPASDAGLRLDDSARDVDAQHLETEAGPPRWGRPGSFALNFSAGYSDDFEETGIVPAALGISWFPIRSVSLDLQAEGAFVSQPGDDAAGGGLALLLRWHFIDRERWSLYADVGIGFLLFDEPVPANAAEFVFTPRAGLGFSYALCDNVRLLTGARWFHISNAQTASQNPGIDSLQVYAGLSFGF